MLDEHGAVLLERRSVELLVRHLPAHTPVVVVVHRTKVPAEARTVFERASLVALCARRVQQTHSSFNMSIRGLSEYMEERLSRSSVAACNELITIMLVPKTFKRKTSVSANVLSLNQRAKG